MSGNAATVTVLYPNKPDLTFDLDYYKDKHMPIAKKFFEYTSHTITQLVHLDPSTKTPKPDSEGQTNPYAIQVVMHFDKLEDFQAKRQDAAGMGEVLGDVGNFTNGEPVFLVGEVVGRS
ncbi:MAG: hypothetical protein M1831_001719 [Alyxoria varia]|nr:MAG: hypothetical protein M1831_001719 [Alyxoria varia]